MRAGIVQRLALFSTRCRSTRMTRVNRRQFIHASLAAAATVTISGTKSSGRVRGANDRVRIAVAGLNGRGHSHTDAYLGMKNVEIVYLVDPDKKTYKKH